MTKYVKLEDVKVLLSMLDTKYEEQDKKALSVNIVSYKNITNRFRKILPIVDIKQQRKSKLNHLEDRVKELEKEQKALRRFLGIHKTGNKRNIIMMPYEDGIFITNKAAGFVHLRK